MKKNFGAKFRGQRYQFGSGAGMQAEFVADQDLFF